MGNRINVAELLKDCPKGMELDCTIYEDVVFHDTVDRHYPIRVRRKQGGLINLNAYGCMDDKIDSKCVIFPKGKTTWEGFVPPYKFKDGDVIFVVNNKSDEDFQYESIAIFKEIKNNKDIYVHGVYSYNDDMFSTHPYLCEITNSTIIKFATEEQKEKLFNLIKINGYNWNPVTKTFEDLTEPKFKNGDIIVCESARCTFISIFKENAPQRKSFIGHCVFDVDDNKFKVKDSASYYNKVRFATKREKELLFVAIERNGYRWDTKTNTLERVLKFKVGDRIKHKGSGVYCIFEKYLEGISAYRTNIGLVIPDRDIEQWELAPNKFDIAALKPFDKVLTRVTSGDVWGTDFFGYYKNGLFHCNGHTAFSYCIPFVGNEHLLGTTNDCDEYFKTWK